MKHTIRFFLTSLLVTGAATQAHAQLTAPARDLRAHGVVLDDNGAATPGDTTSYVKFYIGSHAHGSYTFPTPSAGIAHSSSGGVLSWGAVDLTSDVTNVLGVANGGTGMTSYTAGNLLYASGTSTLGQITGGAANTVLHGGTTPSFGAIVNADVDAAAAIAGTKISPDFGSQNVTTSGNISTTGSGTITAAGGLTATTGGVTATAGDVVATAGGFKTGETTRIANNGDATLGATTTSTLNASGNFSVATNKLTVDASTGNTAIAGTLGVSGASTTAGISNTGSFSTTGAANINTSGTSATQIGNSGANVAITAANWSVSNAGVVSLGNNGDNVTANQGKVTLADNDASTSFTGTVQSADALTQNRTWKMPDASGTVSLGGITNGSTNNSTLRWDNASSRWVENANVLSTAAGQVTATELVSTTNGVTADLGDITASAGDVVTTAGGFKTGSTTRIANNGDATLGATTTTTLDASGDLTVATNKFSVAAASGNTAVAGTLGVTGLATFGNGATVTTGGLTVSAGGASITGATSVTGATGINTGSSTAATNIGNALSTTTLSGTTNINTGVSATPTTIGNANSTTTIAGPTNINTSGSSTTIIGGASSATTVGGTLNANGDFSVNTNKFNVAAATGNTTIAGTTTSTGDLTVGSSKLTVAASTGNTDVAGTLNADGDLSVASNKFTVAAASGNTAVAGTLGVTGATTLTGDLTSNGKATMTQLNGAGTTANSAKYAGSIALDPSQTDYTIEYANLDQYSVIIAIYEDGNGGDMVTPFVSKKTLTGTKSFRVTLSGFPASGSRLNYLIINP